MSLSDPTFLVTTTLIADDTEQKLLSVLVVDPNATKEQIQYYEVLIAACLHSGNATDTYASPAFEQI
jgi:phage portal protein BeeE